MLRLLWYRARHDPRWRALGLPVAGIAAFSIVAAIATWVFLRQAGGPVARAHRLDRMGEHAAAERAYWQALNESSVDLETFIAFLDNHAVLRELSSISTNEGWQQLQRPTVNENQITLLIEGARLDAQDKVLARFWHACTSSSSEVVDARPVTALADMDTPPRWANHLLGRLAERTGTIEEAARRFEREGLAFPEQAPDDLRYALTLWIETGSWNEVRGRLDDPRFAAVIDARLRFRIAEHDRDWPALLMWLWPASFSGIRAWPVALAAASAVLWFLVASRMGRMGDRSSGRKLLYVCAFALGVLSVYPTLVLVTAEDALLGLNPNGQPLIDAIYYVFGVGLREEACKVILFLPLLPLLRKRASRLEALMCGAFVGLGFAAEENIGYFNQMDVSTAIARFLTANFLHMAMTAVVAVAVYDGDRARRGEDLSTAFPLVVGLHGAYDFFLASPVVAGQYSFVAMTVFVILSQRFLRELKVVRPSGERGGLLRHFVLSLTALAGLSYVYATTLIGPAMALQLVAGGLLGDAILIVMFVRELKEA